MKEIIRTAAAGFIFIVVLAALALPFLAFFMPEEFERITSDARKKKKRAHLDEAYKNLDAAERAFTEQDRRSRWNLPHARL